MTFWRAVRLAGCAALLLNIVAVQASAQTAEVTGRVVDASKAVVPGAMIKAVNDDTGLAREARTDGSGTYLLTLYHPVGIR